MTTNPLPMSSNRWNTKIDTITASFTNTFGNLSGEQLNWKPTPGVWSIAQNIDHLIVINQTYYPVIDLLLKGHYKTPLVGKVGFIVDFFGKFILQSVQPDRKRKMKTFPMWEPATSDISGDIIQRFEKHQEELKQKINVCQSLIDQGAVISSPANKNIVYKLETAFDIITTHEVRHFEQAKLVLQGLLTFKP